ncbi:Hydrogenase maturation factor [Halalkaliarchaeum sp. AArc-CO]|uniref:carbamoyltransferase HypF n=1 Tax=unclassified Halalkaliarchaeum TaxID=2678344 RepID=UPI00217F0C18|nr:MULTISPECIES: carbamoyltransferase HypF [unclassified Halalkaliarchaeum]MDR5672186.1 carbamoyltransferase HypF [Halalkaliarchaeum sp. AArc-GB]UWG51692.1 Hydrogenase maturation factor [Halalkaliarchaeum sp. AArc-CO]
MTGSRVRVDLTVQGVVQGVGFRPFVYRRATDHDLSGTVRNTGDAGVEIELEGDAGSVEAFLADLRERPPPLSRVESVEVDRRDESGDSTIGGSEEFRILQSTDDDGGSGTIPPDTGICDRCLEDVRDPESRYHRYWATSCVDCGPRYTVIRELPYDRPRTSMDAFPMCDACRTEYENPADRRYHAQTIACPDCGPTLSLLEPVDGGASPGAQRRERATGPEAIDETARRLARGEIVAIRGIGGTHLACDATDPTVVQRLRERTNRPGKPFAVMTPSVDRIRSFARVSETEREQLEDVRRPIVVLERDDEDLLGAVAPGLHTVGVMLPYAGLHHLLFEEAVTEGKHVASRIEGPLVMTSGNMPGDPMCTSVDEIFGSLSGVIDAALVHDREIVARCDDSVVRVVDGDRRFLRRSRGWIPQPLPRQSEGSPTLALGAEFDSTVALARDDEVFPSQHLGDVDDPATERFLRETVDHLAELLGVDPSVVACDAHPNFLTSKLAAEYATEEPIRVQHHHAHAASLLGEHDRDRAIVIAADGTGYGPNGTIWGGEVLDATRGSFERIGGLGTFRLPGGEAAIERPARILASLLSDPDRIDELLIERAALSPADASTVRQSLEAGVNAPETTSAGRFLDAIAALVGVGTERRYQGEPAIRLEAAASGHDPVDIEIPYRRRDGDRVVDVNRLTETLETLLEREPAAVVAATAQDALARGLAEIAVDVAVDRDVDAIGFTGGVAYNEAISRRIRETTESVGLAFLGHEQVPPGDAGIAYGQAVVATE